MLVEGQMIEMKWNARNKKHFVDLGYTYTKLGAAFMVCVKDLMRGSVFKVDVVCDYCGKTHKKQYSAYLAQRENGKDCCSCCRRKKTTETCLERYGVASPAQFSEFMEKMKNTSLEKYGVDNPNKNKKVRNKSKQTCMERYGCEYPMQSEKIKQTTKNNNLKKYGVESPTQTKEGKEKYIKTCLEKYGVENISQLDETKNKVHHSFFKNGTAPTSKPQQKLAQLLKEMFGEDNCVENYSFGSFNFDCLVNFKGKRIDFEYDGWFWHKNREEKDRKRNCLVVSNGFKVIRIRAKKQFPTKQQIQEAIDCLVKGDQSLIYINLDI